MRHCDSEMLATMIIINIVMFNIKPSSDRVVS